MQIVLANAGTVAHSDPQLQRLHEQLNELNRKITAGEFDIPPEHERSPSPEPIYDANGCRLNTREIRSVTARLLCCQRGEAREGCQQRLCVAAAYQGCMACH
jgi:hypothetical protein